MATTQKSKKFITPPYAKDAAQSGIFKAMVGDTVGFQAGCVAGLTLFLFQVTLPIAKFSIELTYGLT